MMHWPWSRPWSKTEPPPCLAGHEHDWRAWQVVKRGDVMGESLAFGPRPMGYWFLQERQCERCGFTQQHREVVR